PSSSRGAATCPAGRTRSGRGGPSSRRPRSSGSGPQPPPGRARARRELRRPPCASAAAERPELVADEVEGRDEHDRERLGDDLPEAERDEDAQADQVRAERQRRDDEEPQPLVGEVAALAAEGPVAVQQVVVRDRDRERADGCGEVVESRPAQEDRVDGEVDDVTARADAAELRELDPVVPGPERTVRAGPVRCGGGDDARALHRGRGYRLRRLRRGCAALPDRHRCVHGDPALASIAPSQGWPKGSPPGSDPGRWRPGTWPGTAARAQGPKASGATVSKGRSWV